MQAIYAGRRGRQGGVVIPMARSPLAEVCENAERSGERKITGVDISHPGKWPESGNALRQLRPKLLTTSNPRLSAMRNINSLTPNHRQLPRQITV